MDKLQLNYEMGGSGNYLSAFLTEEVNTYQLKMLENNVIAGMLPVHSLMMNGQYKLQYDITGKSRLIDFLHKEEYAGEKARKLLQSFVAALVHAEDYLLTYRQVLLDKDYIYIDAKREVSFVYLPFHKRVMTTAEAVQEFLRTLLLEYFTADGDAFFLGLLRYVSMPEYSLIGLLERLEAGEKKQAAYKEGKESVVAVNLQEEGPVIKAAVSEEKPEMKKPVLETGRQIDSLPKEKESEFENKKEKEEPENVAAYGFAIPGMPVDTFHAKKKEEKQKEKKTTLFGGFKTSKKSKEKPIREEVFTGEKIEKIGKKKAEKEEVWKGTQIVYDREEEERTVCISEDVIVEAVYIRHGETRVRMEHFPFSIGREEADYVLSRPKVSRKHAYIDKKEGRYFILDENSTNHTYVNGAVIAPYTETELVSGDIIRLADESMTFLIEN